MENWYLEYKKLIDNSVENFLIKYFETEKNIGLKEIKKASIYACYGGKRIRSILALEFFLIFVNSNSKNSKKTIKDLSQKDDIIKFCIALELLHGYSLVHDDLPCMDNDILRRGKPTVWKKYGETNAILVGDLLNSLAFELTSDIGNFTIISFYLSQAVGIKGMLGGQVLDLFYEQNPDKLSLDNLIEVHNKKTGALIECSILGGIILAEKKVNFVKDEESNNIKKYLDFGKKIGLAFQIKDDLLDENGTFEETGKSVGNGEKKGFVYFMGIKKTEKFLDDLICEAQNIIKKLNSSKLDFLVKYIGERKK